MEKLKNGKSYNKMEEHGRMENLLRKIHKITKEISGNMLKYTAYTNRISQKI